MDTLRVSLIIIGLLIVGLIYFIGRRQLNADDRQFRFAPNFSWLNILNRLRFSLPKREKHIKEESSVNDEQLSDEDLDEVEPIVAERKEILSDAEDVTAIVELTSEQIAPAGEQLFIPVTILARDGKKFTGESILLATQDCGFKLDESGIYYYEVQDAQGFEQKLLGLANILEPGTFDENKMRTFDTPGLVLYLHLPAPIEAREALSLLIERGRNLAHFLDGDLCDETRSVLTNQTIGHLKEKVEAYRFKQKMTQLKHHRK